MKPSKAASDMSVEELASYIDHSVLKPEFTPDEVASRIRDGVGFGCRTVCVNPASIEIAIPLCEGTRTGICVVVNFPFGASSTESKVAQTKIALDAGVQELDVVSNFGWIRGGQLDRVEDELRAVIELCHAAHVPVKVIFETDALTMEEIKAATEASIAAGADFIKTSTGFFTGAGQHGDRTGAFDEMARFMIESADGRCKVKGSGAIRDRDHFLRLIDMGIDRMGIGYRTTPVVLGLA